MPRLRNQTGVVVSVSDATATLLGREWVSVEDESPAAPAPVKPKTARKPPQTK